MASKKKPAEPQIKTPKKTGRPLKQISAKQVTALASIGCTLREMSAILDCSEDTLERRFADTIKKGSENFRMSLRRLQYKSARKDNVTMLIWLGKQYLGQKDKIENEISGRDGEPIKLDGISDEQLQRMVGELIKAGGKK